MRRRSEVFQNPAALGSGAGSRVFCRHEAQRRDGDPSFYDAMILGMPTWSRLRAYAAARAATSSTSRCWPGSLVRIARAGLALRPKRARTIESVKMTARRTCEAALDCAKASEQDGRLAFNNKSPNGSFGSRNLAHTPRCPLDRLLVFNRRGRGHHSGRCGDSISGLVKSTRTQSVLGAHPVVPTCGLSTKHR